MDGPKRDLGLWKDWSSDVKRRELLRKCPAIPFSCGSFLKRVLDVPEPTFVGAVRPCPQPPSQAALGLTWPLPCHLLPGAPPAGSALSPTWPPPASAQRLCSADGDCVIHSGSKSESWIAAAGRRVRAVPAPSLLPPATETLLSEAPPCVLCQIP